MTEKQRLEARLNDIKGLRNMFAKTLAEVQEDINQCDIEIIGLEAAIEQLEPSPVDEIRRVYDSLSLNDKMRFLSTLGH